MHRNYGTGGQAISCSIPGDYRSLRVHHAYGGISFWNCANLDA